MAAFGLIGACYTNIAISLVFTREAGILKRTRGTPLPGWAYLGARVVHAALVGFLLIAITVAFGVLAYHASSLGRVDLFRFVVTVLVGAGCFSAIGAGRERLGPERGRRPADHQRHHPAVALPLGRLHRGQAGRALRGSQWVGKIFPVRHLADAMRDSFLGSPTFKWSDVAVLALWLVIAAVVAARTFKWEPNR